MSVFPKCSCKECGCPINITKCTETIMFNCSNNKCKNHSVNKEIFDDENSPDFVVVLDKVCENCDGAGKIWNTCGIFDHPEDDWSECTICNGTGLVRKTL